MKAYKHIFPENSLISKQLPAFFADTYAVNVSNAEILSADDIQIQFWTQMPYWVDKLMRLRHWLVRPFGLKSEEGTTEDFSKAIRSGGQCNTMTVIAKSENETVIELSEKHLNAYISIQIRDDKVLLNTVVHLKNTLGRIYFTIIRPFHGILAKSTLKRAVTNSMACDAKR